MADKFVRKIHYLRNAVRTLCGKVPEDSKLTQDKDEITCLTCESEYKNTDEFLNK